MAHGARAHTGCLPSATSDGVSGLASGPFDGLPLPDAQPHQPSLPSQSPSRSSPHGPDSTPTPDPAHSRSRTRTLTLTPSTPSRAASSALTTPAPPLPTPYSPLSHVATSPATQHFLACSLPSSFAVSPCPRSQQAILHHLIPHGSVSGHRPSPPSDPRSLSLVACSISKIPIAKPSVSRRTRAASRPSPSSSGFPTAPARIGSSANEDADTSGSSGYLPQRLSVLRHGGTASVPDLASLVRTARARAKQHTTLSPPPRPASLSLSPPPELRSSVHSPDHPGADAPDYSSSTRTPVRPSSRASLSSDSSNSTDLALPQGSPRPSPEPQSTGHPAGAVTRPPSATGQTPTRRGMPGAHMGPQTPEQLERRLGEADVAAERQAQSSCLPLAADTTRAAMRTLSGHRNRLVRRTGSQGSSLSSTWTWAGVHDTASFEQPRHPGSSTATIAQTPPAAKPTKSKTRHRSVSRPASRTNSVSADPLAASPPPKPPQPWSTAMRKTSGFFRRKLSSQSPGDSNNADLSASSHRMDVSFSAGSIPGRADRASDAQSDSHQSYLDGDSDPPPVPTIPSSYQTISPPAPTGHLVFTSPMLNNLNCGPLSPHCSSADSKMTRRQLPGTLSASAGSASLPAELEQERNTELGSPSPSDLNRLGSSQSRHPSPRNSPGESLPGAGNSASTSPARVSPSLTSGNERSSGTFTAKLRSRWMHTSSARLAGSTSDHSLVQADRSCPSTPLYHSVSPRSRVVTLPTGTDSQGETTPGRRRPRLCPSTFAGAPQNRSKSGSEPNPSPPCPPSNQQGDSPASLVQSSQLLSPRLSVLSEHGLSEEDKLRLSLERWKLDQDGVLSGGLMPVLSPHRLVASTSDLNDTPHRSPTRESSCAAEQAMARPPHQYGTMHDSPLLFSSNSIPSLVNPDRAAPRSKASPSSTSLVFSASAPIPTSHVAAHSSPVTSSSCNSSPSLGTLGAVGSQRIPSRSRSMKEGGPQGNSPTSTKRLLFRRRSHTEDLSGHSPATHTLMQTDQAERASLDGSRASIIASGQGGQGGSHAVVSFEGSPDVKDAEGKQWLTPSIRLVSPASDEAASKAQSNYRSPAKPSSSPKLSRRPVRPSSASRSPVLRSDHLTRRNSLSSSKRGSSPSQSAEGEVQPSGKSERSKAVGIGLGLSLPATPVDPVVPSSPQVPQLKRRDAAKSHEAAQVDKTHKARCRQSSPNLRSNIVTPAFDQSVFSVVVSGPEKQCEQGPTLGMSDTEDDLLVHSPTRSVSYSSSNPNAMGGSNGSAQSFGRPAPLLSLPGLTLEENANRLADLFWQEDESLMKREKLTEWLGVPESSETRLQTRTLKAYMARFDFGDLRIDVAFRKLCTKMYLKGETQQVDRVLAEFSKRFWDQNQSNLYFSQDMVHALSYSVLLLNTDLHIVDTTKRMSRAQFVRNTLETIVAQLPDPNDTMSSRGTAPQASVESAAMSDASRSRIEVAGGNWKFNTNSGVGNRGRRSSLVDVPRLTGFATVKAPLSVHRPSMERWREAFRPGPTPHQMGKSSIRSASITSVASEDGAPGSPLPPDPACLGRDPSMDTEESQLSPNIDGSAQLGTPNPTSPTNSPLPTPGLDGEQLRFNPGPSWRVQFEKEVESLLKEIYMAIKAQPIFQSAPLEPQRYQTLGGLQRVASRRSHSSYSGERVGNYKRASLRGLGGLLSVGTELAGTRPTSPTPSGSTSFSMSSAPSSGFGYSSAGGSSHTFTSLTSPSVGFASNLSQSIIREQQEEEADEEGNEEETLVRDEELALLGAPWAKEGILQRKQYWDSKGKRHKDKSWAQVFVVIQKGSLKMFQFGQSSNHPGSSMSVPASAPGSQMGVGGGNWLPNAQLLGDLSLSHALSIVLVSGYSRERAHVFVLTLASGASYFFQAGTEELVNEWVSTCNYWSARLSKEPLTGGVSNMEYGWNQLQVPEADLGAIGEGTEKREEQQDWPQEQEEMMSIISGHSGHSQKGRWLRDKLFSASVPSSGVLTTAAPPSVGPPQTPAELHFRTAGGVALNQPPPSPALGSQTGAINNRQTWSPIGGTGTPANDKVTISDWNPPVAPMGLSTLPEDGQLEGLKKHAAYMQTELGKHKLLRKPMIGLYWSRTSSLQKALSNWEKKSQYLMAEIIKYTTYINALEATIEFKESMLKQQASAVAGGGGSGKKGGGS